MRACVAALLLALFIPQGAGAKALSYRLEMPPSRDEVKTGWTRDPFEQPVSGEGGLEGALKLSAVFFDLKNPSAIINGMIVYRGSLVSGQKVVDIGVTHVILQGDRGRTRLELSEIPGFQDADKND